MDEPGGGALVIAVCGLAFEAETAAGPGIAAICAPGPARVAACLEALLAAEVPASCPSDSPPRRPGIISFGCAGALDPGLAPGSCVVATSVLTPAGDIAADPAWAHALLGLLPGARAGRLCGLDRPLASCSGKAQLWRDSGACAVDMESHAAARMAQRHGLPFAACRVVLDPAWRDIPSCALAALGEDGSSALLPLLRALAHAPGELGPLCALAHEAWLARRVLRRVRARLGPALAFPLA
jgi:hopanoid-associated phosphorylase